MSTRATIAVRRADQTYAAVYMHFDGYPEHTGLILRQHHQSQEAAETLVAGGDLRCLDADTGEAERFDDGDPPAILPTHDSLTDFARNCGARHLYVFDHGTWEHREL